VEHNIDLGGWFAGMPEVVMLEQRPRFASEVMPYFQR
jgi:hypothetical protein